MPSITTHHLFGQTVLKMRGEDLSPDAYDAFVWGCQGPDPFFFAAFGTRPRVYLRFGQLLHSTGVTRSFGFFLDSARRAEGPSREILRGYLSGYLCHYALDRTAHPYVYARQYEACARLGQEKDLTHFHMRLESAIDAAFSGITSNPTDLLPANRRVFRAVGGMLSEAARTVYGSSLPAGCFRRAAGRMRLTERFLKSKRGLKRRAVSRIERLFAPASLYDAMSHEDGTKGIDDPLNLGKAPWRDPAGGGERTESFPALFEAAKETAVRLIGLAESGADAEQITNGTDFCGLPEKSAGTGSVPSQKQGVTER